MTSKEKWQRGGNKRTPLPTTARTTIRRRLATATETMTRMTVMVTVSASVTVDGRHQAADRHQVAGGDKNGGE